MNINLWSPATIDVNTDCKQSIEIEQKIQSDPVKSSPPKLTILQDNFVSSILNDVTTNCQITQNH